jgi:CheY-like chemotaxis protein
MPTALRVDDNTDVRQLAGHVLAREGFEVREAGSGSAALEALRDGVQPDVVLLDVQMPEVDGWDTLARIRRDPPTAEIPVVLWTVKASPDQMVRGWELGCDGYVVKPFSTRALAEEVRRVTARDREEREQVRRDGLVEAQRMLELQERQGWS